MYENKTNVIHFSFRESEVALARRTETKHAQPGVRQEDQGGGG